MRNVTFHPVCEPSEARQVAVPNGEQQWLTVKELAWALGVSAHYIYQMHACGFAMERRTFAGSAVEYLSATERSAREWIEANNFHLMDNGRGVTNGQLKFHLQADFVTGIRNMIKTVLPQRTQNAQRIL